MPAFLVTVRRSGPKWDASRPLDQQSGWRAHAAFMDGLVEDGFIVLGGPLADEHRVVHAVEAEHEDAVCATFARDPWSETHLHIDTIEPWTLRLENPIDRPPEHALLSFDPVSLVEGLRDRVVLTWETAN